MECLNTKNIYHISVAQPPVPEAKPDIVKESPIKTPTFFKPAAPVARTLFTDGNHFIYKFVHVLIKSRSVVAQVHWRATVTAAVCGFDSHSVKLYI